ncbi:MAG: 30S ribosomal protein S6 [Alphaproteobacteria bacterium]|nr:30S ribosomal protein S6 [Alphaproteobacteria bacterium]
MSFYENVFIVRQDMSQAQVEALADTFSSILVDQGGKVLKREYWGLKNLAFRIKKNKKGHYLFLGIDAPSPAVVEMERNMRINEDILRYLTVHVHKLEEGPTAMMQNHNRDKEDHIYEHEDDLRTAVEN